MKIDINREDLLLPLQQVTGVIEKRHTLPILANTLIKLNREEMVLSGTDLEVQLVAKIPLPTEDVAEITIPARKFLDICRLLPEKSRLSIELQGDKVRIHAGRSRFTLNTLEASLYPEFDSGATCLAGRQVQREFRIGSGQLKKALEKTLFCMAQQDVRYYLNGIMFELDGQQLRLVASDGHRLARYETLLEQSIDGYEQIIVPRKGILELHRLLADSDRDVLVQFSRTNFRLLDDKVEFSSKLVDGKYPDFKKVFPQSKLDTLSVDKTSFKNALSRVSILSNEKYRGISVKIGENSMMLSSYNPEHDEAEEELEIDNPNGLGISAGFNVQYLLDAVSNVDAEEATLSFSSANNSCFMDDAMNPQAKFIVMPMRL